nr:hypothetical protein BaRGS_028845 [Batillaria attramentaria]
MAKIFHTDNEFGLSEGKVKKLRQARGQQLEAEIRGIIRTDSDVNSSLNERPAHLPLSKADRLMEGEIMLRARLSPEGQSSEGQGNEPSADTEVDGGGEEEYEEIFATTIYSDAASEKNELPAVSTQDNLSSLSTLSDKVILESILHRYKQKQIYTYMGDVLIAVNPFTDLPIYGKWASKLYHKAENLTGMTPHVYAVAEHARRMMMSSRSNHCCVIGGESGAGKTETCKLLVQHLMCSAESSEHQLNSKLHQINPLLEAFGNARTKMNSNSSRFAKYLELIFTSSGRVLGGHVHQYLLEKSRVVHQGALEGNFHIFYWLLAGATPEEKTQCCLDDTSFNYLQCDNRDLSAPASNGHNRLLEVKECMKFVGFSQDDVTNMLTTVAAVLHLGNVSFVERDDQEGVKVTHPAVLQKVSSLLRVPYEDLISALMEDVLTARGEELRKPLSVGQALDNRNALAKALYSRLFAWIVNGLNQMVEPLEDAPGERLSIGILDIFGFENLQVNGFEQMCINLANEQLQVFYQQQMFERERQDCLAEGVQPVDVTFPSSKKHDQVYKTPRYCGTSFTIVHYAGAVQYRLEGVLEKNRDTLRKLTVFCHAK